jgi:restriction endonuclease Mrr
MHQALKARDDVQHAEEAQREAEARIDNQLNREREEQERRQSVAEIRAALPEDVLTTLRHRAEEVLATEGVARMHLGYEVLVKLKVDEFLEQEYLPMDMNHDDDRVEITTT